MQEELNLDHMKEVAQAAHDFYPFPWVRVSDKRISVIEQSPRDGSIIGGGCVATPDVQEYSDHILEFRPTQVLSLIERLERAERKASKFKKRIKKLRKTIAREIAAEREDTDFDALGADAYINGLERAERIVLEGRE